MKAKKQVSINQIYRVKKQYIKCVVTDSKGRHVLAGASQSTLKHLYNTGHGNKIIKG